MPDIFDQVAEESAGAGEDIFDREERMLRQAGRFDAPEPAAPAPTESRFRPVYYQPPPPPAPPEPEPLPEAAPTPAPAAAPPTPAPPAEPRRSFARGFAERIKRTDPLEAIPFISGGAAVGKALAIYRAAKGVQNAEAAGEAPDDIDLYILKDARDEMQRRSKLKGREKVGDLVASILVQLPAFAGELALTGGLYTAGRVAGAKAATNILSKFVDNAAEKTATKYAARIAGGFTGTALQAPVAAAFRIPAETISRVTPQFDVTTEEGKMQAVIGQPQDGFASAAAKAFGSNYIEVLSEHSGGLVGGVVGAVAAKIPGAQALSALKAKVANAWLKTHPTKTVDDLLKKLAERTAWHGVFNEILEERLGEIGRAAVGIEDYRPPDLEQLAAEAIGFSVPGAAASTARGISSLQSLPERRERRRRLLSLQDYRGSEERQRELGGFRQLREEQAQRAEAEDITNQIVESGRSRDAEEARIAAEAARAQAAAEQEEAERIRLRNAPQDRVETQTGGTRPVLLTPEPPTSTALDQTDYPVEEMETGRIKLSKDVPNFKAEADPATGIVPGQELKASKYERVGTAPIVVWERLNGDMEVITGRHKLDLARRLGEKTVPVQIVREAQGWTRARAATLDAEANIRDGQGTVGDYANYFRNSGVTRPQAEARGLLSRNKGRAGWAIGKLSSPELYAAFVNERIGEEAAAVIAETAPLDSAKQLIGIRRTLAGDKPGAVKARIQIERARTEAPVQTDLFGMPIFDESNAQAQADEVAQIREELREQILAVRGAANRPEQARKLGVDVRDPQGVRKRIAELQRELDTWEGDWWLNRDLVNKLAERTTKRKPSEKEKEGKEKKPEVLTPPPPVAPAPAAPPPLPPPLPLPTPAPAAAPEVGPGSGLTPEERAEATRLRAELRRIFSKDPPALSGVDPRWEEALPVVSRLTFLYIKDGVVRFRNYAQRMKAELPDIWSDIKYRIYGVWMSAAPGAGIERLNPDEAEQIINELEGPAAAPAGAAAFDREVDAYATYRREILGLDANTPETSNIAVNAVRNAGRFFAGLGRNSWDEITTEDVFAWRATLTAAARKARGEKPLGADSERRYVGYVRKFWEVRPNFRGRQNAQNLFGAFDVKKVRKVRDIDLPKDSISEDDIETLLAPGDQNDVIDVQTDALLELYYATGLRNEDVARLKLSQLDLDNGWLRGVLIEKQDIKGSIPIPEVTVDALRRYLAVRNRLDNPSNDWLFPGEGKSHLRANTTLRRLHNRLKKRAVTTRLGNRPTIHDLRRSIMQHLRNAFRFTEDDLRQVIPHAAQSVEQRHYMEDRPADWEERYGRAPGRLRHNQLFLQRQGRPTLAQGAQGSARPLPPAAAPEPELPGLGGGEQPQPPPAREGMVGEPGDAAADILTLNERSDLGVDGLTRLINTAPNLPERTRRALEGLIRSGLPQRLPGITWAVTDYISGGMLGSYDPQSRLLRFLSFAEAETPIHEFFHHVWYYLQSDDRDTIRAMRLEAIRREMGKARPGEQAELRKLLDKTYSSDAFLAAGLPRDYYHFANEREFFVHMMTDRAVSEFTRPVERNFVTKLRELFRNLWSSLKMSLGLTDKEDALWQQIISGRYQYDQEQAERWNQTNREGAPPPEPNYFQSQDEAAAKVNYGQYEIVNLSRDLIEDRRAAERRLSEDEYETDQFRKTRQKLKELADQGQVNARNSGDAYWEIPGNMPTWNDEELGAKLQALGIDFDVDVLAAMQRNIRFEDNAARQYRRRERVKELQGYVQTLTGLGIPPSDYDELTKTIEQQLRAIYRVEADDERYEVEYLGQDEPTLMTIDQRSREIEANDNRRPDDKARAKSLDLPFVQEAFVKPMESGDKLADRFGRTVQFFRAAMANPNLPPHYKRAIANETWNQLFRFETLAGGFRRFYDRERLSIAKSLRDLERRLTDAKVKRSLAEILLLDALATGKGEEGRTGRWNTRAEVNFLIESYGTIIAFANNLRTNYPNGGAQALLTRLMDYQGNPARVMDAIRANSDPDLMAVRAASGVSDSALSQIIALLNRSKPFDNAIKLILEYGEAKIANEPALLLARAAELLKKGDEFSKAEAAGIIEQLVSKARAAKNSSDATVSAIARDLSRQQIALKALDYGKELFDRVTGTEDEPNPDFQDIKRQAEDAIERRMILNTGGSGRDAGQTRTIFKGFSVKNDDVEINQPQEDIDALDAVYLQQRNFDRIKQWYDNADKYIAAFGLADGEWAADPTVNKSPEDLGFDRTVYLGLLRAKERYNMHQDQSTIFMGSRLGHNVLEQWKLGWRWFRQYLRGLKQAVGPAAREAMGALVNYGNALQAIRAVSQKHRDRIYSARRAALKAHPEFRGVIEDYDREVFNEMASEGRKFGSPVRPGLPLPTYGNEVKEEDIALLHALRNYYDEIRQDVTEKFGRGILVERGLPGTEDYKVFVRPAASVGDMGLPMHLEQHGQELVKGLMESYDAAEKNKTLPTAANDLTERGNDNRVIEFWNANPSSLIRHILDAGRAYRLMDQTAPMLEAQRAAALELMNANDPRQIQNIEDAVQLIVKNFPVNAAITGDVRTYVAEELLNELQQYFRNARSYQSQQAELQKSEGIGGISLASEFTQRASQFLFPSNWYDYGAVNDGELMMLTARAMHEPIMELGKAMERLSAGLQTHMKKSRKDGSPTNYRDHAEASRVLNIVDKLIKDLKNTWNPENPDAERWAVEFPPDLIKASLLANFPVSIRNIVTGVGMAFIRMSAVNRFSNSLAFLQSLKYMHKIIGRLPLDLLVSQQSPVGRRVYQFLKGPGRRLLPSLVSNFAERIADSHIKSVEEVNRLGYSIRRPLREHWRHIWGEMGTYQTRRQAEEERGPVGTGKRFVRNVGRSFAALFQQVGPEYFDKIINAEALAWSDGIERTLRDVAETYGENREGKGEYDPTKRDWLITPEEFSERLSTQGKAKNLAEFRDLLESADISLEKTLNDYYQRLQANRAKGDDTPPDMFTDDQKAALRRAVLREFNASDALNRPTAMLTSRLFRAIFTFQGWITDFLLKLTGSINATRDAKAIDKVITAMPVMVGLAAALAVYGLYSQGMTDWYRRRFQGAIQKQVTAFTKEFWTDWGNAKEATLAALLSQLGYYGDLALFTKGVVVNNRGYDPAGRVLAIGILNDMFNALRGMWNMRHDGTNWVNPLRDFLTKYTAGSRELMTALNPDYKAVREYRGSNAAIGYNAEQLGLMSERTAGNVKPGVYYSATSGIREDIQSSMMQRDARDFDAAYNRLVDYYRKKGIENPEGVAARDFMMLHPTIRGFGGKKPTQDEWDRVFSRMTQEQRGAVNNAIGAWDWASQRIGVSYQPFAGAGGGGAGLGAIGAGLGAGARRSRLGTRRVSLRRGRRRGRRRGARRLRLRRGRSRSLSASTGRIRVPRLRSRRLRLPRPRLTTA